MLARWVEVLDRLAARPDGLADELDWPAKLRLLEGFRDRDGLAWGAPRLALVDLQYADVRLDKGLYNRLVSRGSMKRLVTEEQVTGRDDQPAGGHQGLLPRALREVRRPAGRRVLGLGDLRRRPGVAGPDPDHGADPGHQGATSASCSTTPRTPPSWSTP